MDINDEWERFLSSSDVNEYSQKTLNTISNEKTPMPTPLYISTKTKIAHITNKNNDIKIDILSVFWSIPIISYVKPTNGIVNKQIMIKSLNETDLMNLKEKMLTVEHCNEHIITSINNPEGRITFKDKRKISIGVNKKDITSFRRKKKSVFDNCVVLILRININNLFKEFHIKVFNTGEIEIPGVKEDTTFNLILEYLMELLSHHIDEKLYLHINQDMEVLINSNFNCGFYIKREVLYKILKYEYNIPTIYDPCIYPGIQCKYKFEITNDDGTITIKKIPFMIFRTGSILIMGKCKECILRKMYTFISNLLIEKYDLISQGNCIDDKKEEPTKTKKKHKKQITVLFDQI
jgi:hypothetical protein